MSHPAPSPLLRLFASAGLCVFALSRLSAQTTPPAPPHADDPITLSPFSVQANKDTGYIANDTVVGGRLTTNLLQTPNDVTVLTKDFLSDINALSVNDAAAFLTNATVTLPTDNRDFGTQVTFRGLPTGQNTRDYFIYPIATEAYLIDRIEGARGANSIIYGDGGSGGQLNVVTKRANFTPSTTLGLLGDSHGTRQVTADANLVLRPNLAIRVNVLDLDRRSWIDRYYDKHRAADLAVTFEPWRGGEIRFEGEIGNSKTSAYGYVYSDTSSLWDRTTAVNGPLAANPAASTGVVRFTVDQLVFSNDFTGTVNFRNFGRTTGTFLNISNDQPYSFPNFPVLSARSFRIAPPESNLSVHYSNAALFFEQRLPWNGVMELAASTNAAVREGISSEGNNSYIDVNKVLPNGQVNPNFGKIYSQSTPTFNLTPNYTNNYRAAIAFPLPVQKFSQTFSMVLQRREDFFRPKIWGWARTADPTAVVSPNLLNTSNAVYEWRYWDDPGASLVIPQNNNGYQFTKYLTRDQSQYDALDTLQFNTIGKYFGDRITFVGGVRFDRYHVDGRTGTFDANGYPNGNTNIVNYAAARTSSAGLTYFFVPTVGIYGNYSEGFRPQGDNNPWVSTPTYTTHSRDRSAGVRLKLFDGKLVGSIGYYGSVEGGVLQNVTSLRTYVNAIWTGLNQGSRVIAGPFSILDDTVDLQARGWEADITANVTRHFRLKFNYALPHTTQANADPQLRAYTAANLAQWQAGAADHTNANAATIATNIANIQNLISSAADGRTLNGTYGYRSNILGVYTFDEGLLKRFRVGLGANLYGAQVIGNPTGKPFDYIYNQPYGTALGLTGYSFTIHKVPVDVSLTVSNLLGYDKPVYSAVTVYNGVAYKNAYTYVPPTAGTLSVKFQF